MEYYFQFIPFATEIYTNKGVTLNYGRAI
jgi:hypothetical protein